MSDPQTKNFECVKPNHYEIYWHDSVSASDVLEILMACRMTISEEVYSRLSKSARSFWKEKENGG